MHKYFLLLTLLVAIFLGTPDAQTRIDQAQINKEFDDALSLYNAGMLDQSLLGFEKIIKVYNRLIRGSEQAYFKVYRGLPNK